MSVKTRATFEFVLTGQQRPYGPTVTAGLLTIESFSPYAGAEWRPMDVSENTARRMATAFVGWSETNEPFSPRLKAFREEGPGVWYVRTEADYND